MRCAYVYERGCGKEMGASQGGTGKGMSWSSTYTTVQQLFLPLLHAKRDILTSACQIRVTT